MTLLHRVIPLCLFFSITQPVLIDAQTTPSALRSASRADEIQARRRARQSQLKPAAPDSAERTFIKLQGIKKTLTSSSTGLRLKFDSDAPGWGSLVLGSGLVLGVEYYRPDLADGEVHFRTAAVGTSSRNYLFDTQLTLPRLAGDRLELDFFSRYKAERSINFYGIGPDSSIGDRTDYSRETMEGSSALRWRPIRHFEGGVTGSALWINVGPGIRSGIASTEQVFDSTTAPGIDQQTDFARGGAYIFVDSRINRGNSPRRTQASVTYNHYEDINNRGFSFGVFEAIAQQSIAFFNEKRVITLRALTALSNTTGTNEVPFYLQQTLGGPDDLRGFRLFRFTDRNKLVFNAEYRWEVAYPLDMAIFADAGKVFDDPGQLNLAGLEGAGGFGFRFKTRISVPVRLDFAFSREGFYAWLRLTDILF